MQRDCVDFGVTIKQFANSQKGGRYSPAKIMGIKKKTRFGNPDEAMISTSHVERFNLTMLTNNRRFTRLTSAHSKSLKHHIAMQNIFFAWYSFCRNHSTIGMTPAVASGLAEETWTVKELIYNAAK
ncbi:MAG: transposase [Planctomycetes bacterium]|nr:transposase [Planctomycetota bacterium]